MSEGKGRGDRGGGWRGRGGQGRGGRGGRGGGQRDDGQRQPSHEQSGAGVGRGGRGGRGPGAGGGRSSDTPRNPPVYSEFPASLGGRGGSRDFPPTYTEAPPVPSAWGAPLGPPPLYTAAPVGASIGPPSLMGQHAQRPQAPPAFPRSPETPADAPVAQPAQVSESQPKKGKGKKGGKGGAEGKPVATETSTTSTAAPAPGDLTVPAKSQPQKGKGKEGKAGTEDKPAASAASTSATVEIVKKTEKMTLESDKNLIPRRKSKIISHSPVVCADRMSIEVNYLQLDIKDRNLRIFHYDCSFTYKPNKRKGKPDKPKDKPDKRKDKPDKPKSLPKGLLRRTMDAFRNKHFPKRSPAFDGMKNLYFGGTALQTPGDVLRDTVKILDPERQNEMEVEVTIKLVRDHLSLSDLFRYIEGGGTTKNMPQEVIQATDIALRQGPIMRLTPCGRSFFRPPGPREPVVDLTGGFDLWHGHYQSAIMAWKPYLNVDVSNKAFPKEQSVFDYIQNEFQIRIEQLSGDIARKVHTYLKGLKIEYRMPSNEPGGFSRRVYRCDGLDVNSTAMSHKFQPEDRPTMFVAEYYQREKNTRLKYPNLPLVKAGNKGTMLPMEFCHIIGNQPVMRKLTERQTANMVRSAAQGTDIRKNRIMQSIREAAFANNPCLKEFGISVASNFENVDAYVLKPPELQYNQSVERVRNGVWNGGVFKYSPALNNWVILNTDSRQQSNVGRVINTLIQSGRELGMQVAQPVQTLSCRDSDVQYKLKEIARNKPQLCVVIMSSYLKSLYGTIKRTAEFELGLLTQCIKANTVQRFNPMTAKNILLKVNAKICGQNHTLAFKSIPKPVILNKPVMIVGADVTHPAPGIDDFPSIAAVSASHDLDGFRYNMSYRIQRSREEMIIELADMLEVQLRLFREKTGTEAEKILYYRDGVSEGQFHQVLSKELPAIRKACARIRPGYEPGITFVVVQKRHHTRFFPGPKHQDGPKNKNVLAGTLVDNTITHPTELDFYLVSHQSIQGTARPTKYHLLWDDNDFDGEELERLTYYLCYMFTRCNRSVSYPAPTYYAHLGAFRARAWFEGQREQEQTAVHPSIVNGNPMFFV